MKIEILRIPMLPPAFARLAKLAADKGVSVTSLAAQRLADSPVPAKKVKKKTRRKTA